VGPAATPLRLSGIVDGPLTGDLLHPAALAHPASGAIASFLGTVRDHHHGRGVTRLHYECYRPMAEKVLAALVAEAAERCDPGLAASVHHGTGGMTPGQVSVVIHVASAHRVAAFDACRHLIERIKQDLPVWKRESYADGSDAWLKGS
jgi:molybdopterin synthase catalytic subunit